MKNDKNDALNNSENGKKRNTPSVKQQTEHDFRSIPSREEPRRKNGVGGYLAAIITLGIATLILASVLTFNLVMPTESDVTLESSYKKSFYEVMAEVDNMDLNLSKSLNSKDTAAMQGYLLDLAVNSELAENGIQQLPLKDENKFYTSKLINQIGDYAKYILKKL
ncbi:MAG: germination protein YpeB, partial [Clostridia bacterium]|nr:germination protein YpeB [Clostridia bacterium]